jgi:hypothetical protein
LPGQQQVKKRAKTTRKIRGIGVKPDQ